MARRAGKREVVEDSEVEAIEGLERLLGHRFNRPELLTLALTHRSYVYDRAASGLSSDLAGLSDPSQDNEQLEFMGDAALGLLAAEALCRRFPGSREGELTKLRASVVSRQHLGKVGTRMGLGRWLRLGHTAEKNAGRTNAALFANTVEALIAALYLDGGLEAARRFVEDEVLAGALPERPAVDGERIGGTAGDHKSALQELLQASGMGRPRYHLLEESGPDHRRVFRVEVRLDGDGTHPGALAEAEGPTKKRAQQEAARLAFAKLADLKATDAAEVVHG
jgi:ribonuclease-3